MLEVQVVCFESIVGGWSLDLSVLLEATPLRAVERSASRVWGQKAVLLSRTTGFGMGLALLSAAARSIRRD